MKTKNKVLALVEITIVLCSVFLVALPGIAAAASELYEAGPLDIFGNANEDDTIDMRDTTYIKLVIFGKKPETKLADANNDGKISMLDVGQAKLIILGKEKKLTFIDIFGEAVTVNKPIKRLANVGYCSIDITRMLGAMDILLPIVGYDRSNWPSFYPVMSKWAVVGYEPDNCDFEYILSLEPDAVQTNLESSRFLVGGLEKKRMFEERLPGIPIICLNMRDPDISSQNVRTYGYILDNEDEAEEFINWYEGHLSTFKTRTDELSEDEKPRVYLEMRSYGAPQGTFEGYLAGCTSGYWGRALAIAGGANILECPSEKTSMEIDPEWVIEQNPAFIIKWGVPGWALDYTHYETDDPSVYVAERQEILNRPELANVDAVKNGHVYIIDAQVCTGAGTLVIGIAYMGKWLHPDLFADIDPQAIHQEYIEFCRIGFDVREHGVFVYPPPLE